MKVGYAFMAFVAGVGFLVLAGCESEIRKPDPTSHWKVETVFSDLQRVMGIEVDEKGNIWISEKIKNGKGIYSDKISVITADGKKWDVVKNLPSSFSGNLHDIEGTGNILMDGSLLYFLSANHLYQVDLSSFFLGDLPFDGRLLKGEDIHAEVKQVMSVELESHYCYLTKGEGGEIFIVDANTNAIVQRKTSGDYFILAYLPITFNPTPVSILPKVISPGLISDPSLRPMGGPIIQAVPTSVLYKGDHLLVSTFSGFPFREAQAIIYHVNLSGEVRVRSKGWSLLTAMEKGQGEDLLVVRHAVSYDLMEGYAPHTGAILKIDDEESTLLLDRLNQPVCIKQADERTWYVAVRGDGTIIKLEFEN